MRQVRPNNDPVKDIARKLAVREDLFLVGMTGEEMVASAMAGYLPLPAPTARRELAKLEDG